jgi:hypothetical protein
MCAPKKEASNAPIADCNAWDRVWERNSGTAQLLALVRGSIWEKF